MYYITEGDREGEEKREREKDSSEKEEESLVMLTKYFLKGSIFVLYYFTKRDSCYPYLSHQSEGCL